MGETCGSLMRGSFAPGAKGADEDESSDDGAGEEPADGEANE